MSGLDMGLVVAAYLVGSIPFGMLVARVFGSADLRSQGSGNIGATNAARVLGKRAGALTLACDLLKGAGPVWVATAIAGHAGHAIPMGVAAAAVIGHIFPVYLRFRGGKGVATGFGVLMALHFPTALVAVVIWLAAVKLSGVSAVGALATYLLLPLTAWGAVTLWPPAPEGPFLFFVGGLSMLVVIRHHDNIRLLFASRR